MDMLWYRTVW
uniref:Uncharacterized protein n=1 Tax=Anguilla anguilla TaxID=7936 RepID=A0A0E9XMS7_ANGAN